MSMVTLTVIQFIEMLLAYCAVTVALPGLILRKRLGGLPGAERMAGYFLAGNVYVIYLVFLLQFLHISGRFTLTVGTLVPFGILFVRKYKPSQMAEMFHWFLLTVQHILQGELGIKTLLYRGIKKLFSGRLHGRGKKLLPLLPDILLTAGVAAAVIYIYGDSTFHIWGYKASDLPVHNYWVNMMGDNRVFGSGVYPYGFHCIIYYLHTVFGIKTYILFRVFALVQTIFIHLALLVSLKILCRSRFIPYFGVGIYLLADIFSTNTYYRFAATLPQEYGMMFIFPAACFAVRFLQKNKRIYLLGFILSFSLTLTVHFYNTMIAGIFCVGIAMGFCFRCFKWKYLKKLLIAGLLSVAVAVLPLLIGVAMGRGLEGSLYWGMKVINGTVDAEEQMETTTITDVNGNEVTVVGQVDEETLEKVKNGTITKEIEARESSGQKSEAVQRPGFGKRIYLKLYSIIQEIRTDITNGNIKMVYMILAGIGIVTGLGLVSVLLRKKDYGGMLLSTGAYMLLMCIMQSLKVLGLPELMDAARNSIFFAYSVGLLWAVAADAVIDFFVGWTGKKWLVSFVSLAVITASGASVVKAGRLRGPEQVNDQINALETNGAIMALTNIIRDNEDFTWTIVSANDELRMTEKFGYHYEIITMLKEMEDMSGNPEITIPTDTVYFFVEKQPVNYAKSVNGMELGPVSAKWARKSLTDDGGLEAYTGTERWVTMSHMYYWAQEFQKLYPNEMEVYVETDDFICYRLKQNGYSLYNLAIDYGYNDSEKTEE